MKADQDTVFGHILSLHDKMSRFDKIFRQEQDTHASRKVSLR